MRNTFAEALYKSATANPDVYVVGECAQHRGRVYGLVAPLWEQATVFADHVTGRRSRGLRPYPHARGRPATCSSSASSR